MEVAINMGEGLCGQRPRQVTTHGKLETKLKNRINTVSYEHSILLEVIIWLQKGVVNTVMKNYYQNLIISFFSVTLNPHCPNNTFPSFQVFNRSGTWK